MVAPLQISNTPGDWRHPADDPPVVDVLICPERRYPTKSAARSGYLIHIAIVPIAGRTAMDVDSTSIKLLARQYGRYGRDNGVLVRGSNPRQRNRHQYRMLLIFQILSILR
jgi:hypothetical protein